MKPGTIGLVQVLRVPLVPGDLGIGRLLPSGVSVWLLHAPGMADGSTWGCQRTWNTHHDIAIFRPIDPALEASCATP